MSNVIALTDHEPSFEGRPRDVIITGPGFQDHDNIYCGYRLREAGFRADFATVDGGPVVGKHGTRVPLDRSSGPNVSFDDLDVDAYDLVILTGGHEAPDRVRQDKRATEFVAAMAAGGKLVAGLCHGPWVMVSARIMAGVQACPYPGCATTWSWPARRSSTRTSSPTTTSSRAPTTARPGSFMRTVIAIAEDQHGTLRAAA